MQIYFLYYEWDINWQYNFFFLNFVIIVISPRNLNAKKNFFKKLLKSKEQGEIVNVNDDEENFNEEISLQNDKHDDNIDFDVVY